MCVCLLSALPQSSTPSYRHSSPLTWQELSDEVSCTVRVRLTERDLDSLQEAYIGGGIKGTDKDKTISLSLSNAQTHCPTCTHFSHCSSTSVCVCVWGGGGRREGGTTCWVTHVHARRQREGPTYVAIAI